MAPALADGAGETRRPSFAPRNAGDIRNAGTIAAPPFADEVDPDEEAFLWESVREGDQNALWDLLVGDEEHPPCGLPVDCTDAAGMTPLHWLTVEGHDSVAQWLIDEVGATVDAPDARHGLTALHFAATKGKATAAGLLLRSGADPVRRDSAGWTPLHAAARSGYLDVCHTLLGALSPEQIDLTGPGGCTALHRAAYWGQLEVASRLVEAGADMLAADVAGRRPFEVACAGGELYEVLPKLLKLLRPNATK